MVSSEFKLFDVADMSYTWEGNRSGEVWLRGPQMFDRYYRDEVKIQESVDADGWFHTGDVARLDDAGRLCIIDRVKAFAKLSFGEYVSPNRIESVYCLANPLDLLQIYVHADPFQSYLVGVVVVEDKMCQEVCLKSSLPKVKELKANWGASVEFRLELLDRLNAAARATGLLNGMEVLKNIHLFTNSDGVSNLGFTDANGLMTPTLKLKPQNCRTFFEALLKQMYAEGDITSRTGRV